MFMNNFCIHVFIALLTLAGKLKLGEGKKENKHDFVQVHVPTWVREGETAFLECLYDVDRENLYSMKWYKGSQEFFRYTPKEAPPIKTFPGFGGEVDLSLSNSSVVALTSVSLNMTDKYTCEVTKDLPDYTTSLKAGRMNVVALPERKPMITTTRKLVSIGDSLTVNCTSFRSNPAASITWLLNGFLVRPHYLTPESTHREQDNKESITSGLHFIVRQHDFIKSRMTITCQAMIEPDLYNNSAEIVILEANSPKISSVVDDPYSSLSSAGGTAGKSDNRVASNSGGSLLTIPSAAAVPLAHLFLVFVTLISTTTLDAGIRILLPTQLSKWFTSSSSSSPPPHNIASCC